MTESELKKKAEAYATDQVEWLYYNEEDTPTEKQIIEDHIDEWSLAAQAYIDGYRESGMVKSEYTFEEPEEIEEMESSMNIFAMKGHKVMVTEKTKSNGYDCDKERVAELLEVGVEYTIERTNVHSTSTSVYLQEFPAKVFNSVNFISITKQSKEDDSKHPYGKMWIKS